MKDFNAYLKGDGAQHPDLLKLKQEVEEFGATFPMPGIDETPK